MTPITTAADFAMWLAAGGRACLYHGGNLADACARQVYAPDDTPISKLARAAFDERRHETAIRPWQDLMGGLTRHGGMALNGKHVLIVEDEPLIAMGLASEITKLGGDAIGRIANVDTALHVIGTSDLDGAIVDIKLSRERTFRVADALANRQVPFVFATATPAKEIPARFAKVPWFEKPYVFSAVCSAIEGMIARRGRVLAERPLEALKAGNQSARQRFFLVPSSI